jgi:hypothetical protein
LRAVEFAIAHQQTDLTCGRVQVALMFSCSPADDHFVLIEQVQAEGGLRAVGQGEVIGTVAAFFSSKRRTRTGAA